MRRGGKEKVREKRREEKRREGMGGEEKRGEEEEREEDRRKEKRKESLALESVLASITQGLIYSTEKPMCVFITVQVTVMEAVALPSIRLFPK